MRGGARTQCSPSTSFKTSSPRQVSQSRVKFPNKKLSQSFQKSISQNKKKKSQVSTVYNPWSHQDSKNVVQVERCWLQSQFLEGDFLFLPLTEWILQFCPLYSVNWSISFRLILNLVVWWWRHWGLKMIRGIWLWVCLRFSGLFGEYGRAMPFWNKNSPEAESSPARQSAHSPPAQRLRIWGMVGDAFNRRKYTPSQNLVILHHNKSELK